MAVIGFKPNGKPEVKILESKSPRVIISDVALFKMKYIVKHSPKEVGWLGSVYKTVVKQDEWYVISDIFLFEQEVHATTTEITPEGLTKFAEKLIEQPDGCEIWNSIKMWGHSHVNMGVTPSAQDNAQMKTFEKDADDFFIRIIANKAGELRLDLFDFIRGLEFSCVEWQREVEEFPEMEKEIMVELKEKVKDKPTMVYPTTGSYGGNYGGNYGGSYNGQQTNLVGNGKSWWEIEREKKLKESKETLERINAINGDDILNKDQINIWEKEKMKYENKKQLKEADREDKKKTYAH